MLRVNSDQRIVLVLGIAPSTALRVHAGKGRMELRLVVAVMRSGQMKLSLLPMV